MQTKRPASTLKKYRLRKEIQKETNGSHKCPQGEILLSPQHRKQFPGINSTRYFSHITTSIVFKNIFLIGLQISLNYKKKLHPPVIIEYPQNRQYYFPCWNIYYIPYKSPLANSAPSSNWSVFRYNRIQKKQKSALPLQFLRASSTRNSPSLGHADWSLLVAIIIHWLFSFNVI